MTTTELYSGLSEGKPSSRVSNPPGGRSNNIFGSDEPPAPKPQAKVPQQPAEGQTGGADADTPAPTHEIYTRNRPKKQAQAYNPITGEEIPADRSRNSSPKVAPTPASTPSQDHSTAAPTTTPNSATSPPPSIPTSDPTTTASPSRKIHTSSKVLKPPGGGSSGPLW